MVQNESQDVSEENRTKHLEKTVEVNGNDSNKAVVTTDAVMKNWKKAPKTATQKKNFKDYLYRTLGALGKKYLETNTWVSEEIEKEYVTCMEKLVSSKWKINAEVDTIADELDNYGSPKEFSEYVKTYQRSTESTQ